MLIKPVGDDHISAVVKQLRDAWLWRHGFRDPQDDLHGLGSKPFEHAERVWALAVANAPVQRPYKRARSIPGVGCVQPVQSAAWMRPAIAAGPEVLAHEPSDAWTHELLSDLPTASSGSEAQTAVAASLSADPVQVAVAARSPARSDC